MCEDITKTTARDKILHAAAELFAEKSFDGARVDEIATLAQVPKSLIYYHFKSKDEIFNVLIQEFLEEYRSIVESFQNPNCHPDAEEIKRRMKQEYFQFGIAHENVVRAILMDSLKKKKSNTALFQMIQLLEKEGKDEKYLVEEFLFNIMPSMAYICFKEGWLQYFNIKPELFDQAFLETYASTHRSYHNQDK